MRACACLLTLAGLAASLASCSSAAPTPATATALPTMTVTAAPSLAPSVTGSLAGNQGDTSLLTNNCGLLDSRYLASLYSSAEVVPPTPAISRVPRVIFSQEDSPASETLCTYYVFHQPGSGKMIMTQINYWVDVPSQAAASTVAKAWNDARGRASQQVTGLADAAFFSHGRLTLKRGDIYLTIEVLGTQLETSTPAGQAQQLSLEKGMAQNALKNFSGANLP